MRIFFVVGEAKRGESSRRCRFPSRRSRSASYWRSPKGFRRYPEGVDFPPALGFRYRTQGRNLKRSNNHS
jgi:hypothetical protein